MDNKPLRVISCPLCEIFLNPKENIKTRFYYPDSIDEIPKSEFVILDCSSCRAPMIVYSEHVMDITNEAWGRILYQFKKIFGKDKRLRTKARTVRDHWHAHMIR